MGGRGSSSPIKHRDDIKRLGSTDIDTRDLHTRDGKYTDSRQRVHDRISRDMLNNSRSPRKGERLVAHLVVDGDDTYANTILRRNLSEDKKRFKHQVISQSSIGERLPEYKKLVNYYKGDMNKALAKTRREANSVFSDIVERAGGTNLVIRSDFSNPKSTAKLIKQLKSKGYSISVYQSQVSGNKVSNALLKKYGDTHLVYDVAHNTVSSVGYYKKSTNQKAKKLSPEEVAKRDALAKERREARRKAKADRDFEKLWNNLFGGN